MDKKILVIKSNGIDGNDILDILLTLGGKNEMNLKCNNNAYLYYIQPSSNIIYNKCCGDLEDAYKYQVFEYRDFNDKYPFRKGNLVNFKENPHMTEVYVCDMLWTGNDLIYKVSYKENKEDITYSWVTVDEIVKAEPKQVETPVEEKTEEIDESEFDVKQQVFTLSDSDEIELGDAYTFKYKVIRKNGKQFLIKEKNEFPQTISECVTRNDVTYYEGYQEYRKVFKALLYARNTYWKICNDWKPNYADSEVKYAVTMIKFAVTFTTTTKHFYLFCFPSKEICLNFIENYKGLLEYFYELSDLVNTDSL